MTTELTHITDHARRAILNLNWNFIGKPRIASFVWALTSEWQELEDAIQSVIQLRQVDFAELPQLKVLGRIVGQPYASETKEIYRALIKARVRANRSNGTADDLLSVIQLVFDGTPEFWTELNATVCILLDGETDAFRALNTLLRDAKAAHESLYLYHNEAASGLRFANSNWVSTPATGYRFGRSGSPSVGDKLFRVLDRR